MQNNIVEKVLDILIDARNRNLTMGSILHSDCRYFASTLVKNDVVPVVRCKDCKHSTERQGFENRMWNDDCVMCDHIAPSNRIPMNKNDFCSYGERKEDNE